MVYRFIVFKVNNGEVIYQTNSRDELYNRFYNLNRDLSHNYLIFDNLINDYFNIEEV